MDEMEGYLAMPYCVHVLSKLEYWRAVDDHELCHKAPRTSTLGRGFAFEGCVVAAEHLITMLGKEGVGSGWTGVTSADRSPF